MLNRGDYWQCAFVIPKGSAEDVRRRGIERIRAQSWRAPSRWWRIASAEIADWKQVHLLTVTVNRLRQWHRPGLLCIGDAAHAMSPIGGVGINLAVQDAVAAANVLADPLYEKRDVTPLLPKVQERREFPTRATQRLQLAIQNNGHQGRAAGRRRFPAAAAAAADGSLRFVAADSGATARPGLPAGAHPDGGAGAGSVILRWPPKAALEG